MISITSFACVCSGQAQNEKEAYVKHLKRREEATVSTHTHRITPCSTRVCSLSTPGCRQL